MAKVIKTTEDGWDCVPELMEAVDCINELDHDIYEITNCVRQSDLESMVENMRDQLSTALDILDNIDTDVEYITDEHVNKIKTKNRIYIN